MNFLSHYYLDAKTGDDLYNVGLSVPDLLGFLKNRVRVNEKLILSLKCKNADIENHSLYDGMIAHLKRDRWFHTSEFFKTGLEEFQKYYNTKTGILLPNFNAHIILEMLIDKYILENNPGIHNEFYTVYRCVNYDKVVSLLIEIEGLDIDDLKAILFRFSHSTYIGEYNNIDVIVAISNKVSKQFNTGMQIQQKQQYDAILGFYENYIGAIQDMLSNHKM